MVKQFPPKSMVVPAHNGHESDIRDEESQEATQSSIQPLRVYGSGIKKSLDLEKDSITPCDSEISTTTPLSQSSNTSEL